MQCRIAKKCKVCRRSHYDAVPVDRTGLEIGRGISRQSFVLALAIFFAGGSGGTASFVAEGVDAKEEEQRAGQAEEEEEDGGGVEERRLPGAKNLRGWGVLVPEWQGCHDWPRSLGRFYVRSSRAVELCRTRRRGH